jgi:hypothetical protein
MKQGIIILGNGGTGTSLLRGLLNAHPVLHVMFEFGRGSKCGAVEEIESWKIQAEKCSLIWGNKIPLEQFISRGWGSDDVHNIIDDFKVIWLFRRYSKYHKNNNPHDEYTKNWKWAQSLYWEHRELSPENVIQLSFEDLLLRTEDELKRVCGFIGIEYDSVMLTGTNDTGFNKYNQGGINKGKV